MACSPACGVFWLGRPDEFNLSTVGIGIASVRQRAKHNEISTNILLLKPVPARAASAHVSRPTSPYRYHKGVTLPKSRDGGRKAAGVTPKCRASRVFNVAALAGGIDRSLGLKTGSVAWDTSPSSTPASSGTPSWPSPEGPIRRS